MFFLMFFMRPENMAAAVFPPGACMRRSIPVLTALLLSGCGEEDVKLWGSIDETFSLAWDRHEIKKQGTSLLIEYVRELGDGTEEKPCKLVVETANLEIVPNSDLLAETFTDEIVTLYRVAGSGGEFPGIAGGTLHFDDYAFFQGGLISGNFTVLFENGRNLFGNFSAIVEEIE
jgi:hypothetical protein